MCHETNRKRGFSSVGRARAQHARGLGFDSPNLHLLFSFCSSYSSPTHSFITHYIFQLSCHNTTTSQPSTNIHTFVWPNKCSNAIITQFNQLYFISSTPPNSRISHKPTEDCYLTIIPHVLALTITNKGHAILTTRKTHLLPHTSNQISTVCTIIPMAEPLDDTNETPTIPTCESHFHCQYNKS